MRSSVRASIEQVSSGAGQDRVGWVALRLGDAGGSSRAQQPSGGASAPGWTGTLQHGLQRTARAAVSGSKPSSAPPALVTPPAPQPLPAPCPPAGDGGVRHAFARRVGARVARHGGAGRVPDLLEQAVRGSHRRRHRPRLPRPGEPRAARGKLGRPGRKSTRQRTRAGRSDMRIAWLCHALHKPASQPGGRWRSKCTPRCSAHWTFACAPPPAQASQELLDLTDLVRGQLSEQDRLTLGALITIDVHARDVVQELAGAGEPPAAGPPAQAVLTCAWAPVRL
jgi:hypothetical protein